MCKHSFHVSSLRIDIQSVFFNISSSILNADPCPVAFFDSIFHSLECHIKKYFYFWKNRYFSKCIIYYLSSYKKYLINCRCWHFILYKPSRTRVNNFVTIKSVFINQTDIAQENVTSQGFLDMLAVGCSLAQLPLFLMLRPVWKIKQADIQLRKYP